jgi:hypothetical protein
MNRRPESAIAGSDAPPPIRTGRRLSEIEERELLSAIGQELRTEISARWPQYYPARVADGPASLTVVPRRCGFSAIYRVDIDFPANRGRESLIVKIRREQRQGSFRREDLSERILAFIRAEYNEHVNAARYFTDRPGLSVVRPLDFIESHAAFVVEFAAGEDLSKLVRQNSALVPAAMTRAGAWWRLFHHDLHRSERHAWSPEAVDRMIERRLTRLGAIGAPAATLETLRQEIVRVARVVEPSDVPVSLIHGDCKLRHIWATADQIQVLDFGNTSIGDAWLDPAALVVELSLYSLWTTRMDSAGKVADIGGLLHAYFDGPPPPAFALYVVDALLKKWHRRLRNWGAGAGLTQLRDSLRVARLDGVVDRFYIDRWFTTQARAWLAFAEGRPPTWLAGLVQ